MRAAPAHSPWDSCLLQVQAGGPSDTAEEEAKARRAGPCTRSLSKTTAESGEDTPSLTAEPGLVSDYTMVASGPRRVTPG